MLIMWYIYPDLSHRIGWFLGDNKPNMIMGHCENCPCKQNANKFSQFPVFCKEENNFGSEETFPEQKDSSLPQTKLTFFQLYFPFSDGLKGWEMHLFSPFRQGASTPKFPPHHDNSSIYSTTCYEMNYFVIAWVETQFFMVVTHFLWSLIVFLCMIICISLWVLSLRRRDRRDRTTQWCLYDSHEFWWDNINSRDITPQTPTAMYMYLLIWYHSVFGLSHVGLRMLKIENGKP